jgi:hypothetical protein
MTVATPCHDDGDAVGSNGSWASVRADVDEARCHDATVGVDGVTAADALSRPTAGSVVPHAHVGETGQTGTVDAVPP